MSNLEKVEEKINSWLHYYEGKLNEIKEKEAVMIKLANILDNLQIEISSCGYNSIDIETRSIEESRKILSQILEKTDIDKFIKISHQIGDELCWSYTIEYEKIVLSITPAEPNKNCVPVKRINSYTTWTCEKMETE